VSGKDSPGIEYLKHLTKAEHEERTRRLSKDFVLYLCPDCRSGVWYTKTQLYDGKDYLPESFPCGAPCFGTMYRQKEPEFWEGR
jgi:hypothetical protein